MKAVIQRVTKASVTIEGERFSEIGNGLLILLGVSPDDSKPHATWLANKIAQLRIFSDQDGKMNHSLLEIKGEALVVSQFTLMADASKGNRPSYIRAAKPDIAIPLYKFFCSELSQKLGNKVKTGIFAADMKVELLNNGPVTLILDTEELMAGKI